MAPPPAPLRRSLDYKKPRRLNVVSGVMALIFGGGVYYAVAIWPLVALRSNVKDQLAEALPDLWKINLGDEAAVRRQLTPFRKKLLENLRKAGVKDKKLELVVDRNKKVVALQARYAALASFPGIGKRIEMKFAPRVETDARRNDW